MRIIAGEARGRILKTPEGKGTRPTDSRAKETLFNIIGARVVEARFLDLYAGSGAIGLEALSRGAKSCLFVEQNAGACRVIRENLRTLKWEHYGNVWQASVKGALGRLLEQEEDGRNRFDIIFADPPFDRATELPELCSLLDNAAELLHNGKEQSFSPSLLVIQHHRKAQPQLSPAFHRVDERRVGESTLSFFELHTGDAPEQPAAPSELTEDAQSKVSSHEHDF